MHAKLAISITKDFELHKYLKYFQIKTKLVVYENYVLHTFPQKDTTIKWCSY